MSRCHEVPRESLACSFVVLPLIMSLSSCVYDPQPATMIVANESDVKLRIILKGDPVWTVSRVVPL